MAFPCRGLEMINEVTPLAAPAVRSVPFSLPFSNVAAAASLSQKPSELSDNIFSVTVAVLS